MAKVAKFLGLSLTDDQRREHKKRRLQLKQIDDDLNELNAILNNMRWRYMRNKYNVFFFRYGAMKSMVKSAVEQVRQVIGNIQKRSKKVEVERQGNARDFAEATKKLAEQENYYSEMSAKQAEKEMSDFKKEIRQKEEEFKRKREAIERLDEAYKNSKNLTFRKRYKNLKKMIKDTISDSR